MNLPANYEHLCSWENLTSQLWANCYLNSFDHFVKRELRCAAYVRYVDDFLLLADDKRMLWQWKEAVEQRLARLRLTIHPAAQPRRVGQGTPFLGFVLYPDRRRLKRRQGIDFQRKLRALIRSWQAGRIEAARVTVSVRSWVDHVRHGNTVGLRKAVLGHTLIKPIQPVIKRP